MPGQISEIINSLTSKELAEAYKEIAKWHESGILGGQVVRWVSDEIEKLGVETHEALRIAKERILMRTGALFHDLIETLETTIKEHDAYKRALSVIAQGVTITSLADRDKGLKRHMDAPTIARHVLKGNHIEMFEPVEGQVGIYYYINDRDEGEKDA